jgi:hypothetical protein
MTLYRCHFSDAAGSPIGKTLIQSQTDAGAKKIALRFLRGRSEIRRLEAWREADLAFRLSRLDIDGRV